MLTPKYLYRGDCDPHRVRRLKETWGTYGVLFTNMSNGGDPTAIFNCPLIDSIDRHVSEGWKSTHFLSFSESPEVAGKYARGLFSSQLVECGNYTWDALLLKIDTTVFFDIQEIEAGMFVGSYRGRSPLGYANNPGSMFMRYCANKGCEGSTVRVLLIDLVSQIRFHKDKRKNVTVQVGLPNNALAR
jgi:hypothetical protein